MTYPQLVEVDPGHAAHIGKQIENLVHDWAFAVDSDLSELQERIAMAWDDLQREANADVGYDEDEPMSIGDWPF
jgi:hypothetical protein